MKITILLVSELGVLGRAGQNKVQAFEDDRVQNWHNVTFTAFYLLE